MDKKQLQILIPLGIAFVVTITVAITLLIGRVPEPVAGELEKPEFEQTAVSGAPSDMSEGLDYRPLQIADGFQVALCGNLILKDEMVELYFTSDKENTVWTRVRVLDEAGNVLGESGLLKPGEYMKSLRLTNPPSQSVPAVVKVMSYEPDTYYSKGSAHVKLKITVE